MKQEIRSKLKERRENDMKDQLSNLINDMKSEGYEVTFGEIGEKTTYALLSSGDDEIVGYTFIKDIKFKNEIVGKYKALQQAITRKSVLEQQKESQDSEETH